MDNSNVTPLVPKDKKVIEEASSFAFLLFGTRGVTLELSIIFFQL